MNTPKSRVVAIIQARMTSSRLPKKVLMKLGNISVLEHMILRVKKVRRISNLVIATTINFQDNPIVELSQKLKVNVFRGSEKDVLERYYLAAKKFNAENVLRLTADCPMIDPFIIDEMILEFLKNDYDYLSNTVERTYPIGLDAEIFTFKALENSFNEAKNPELREHVTLFINGKRKNLSQGNFKIRQFRNKENLSKYRLTIDTKEDLVNVREIIHQLPTNYTFEDIVNFLKLKPNFSL